jgi:hypothetical protein
VAVFDAGAQRTEEDAARELQAASVEQAHAWVF